jgi:hypothetical protein
MMPPSVDTSAGIEGIVPGENPAVLAAKAARQTDRKARLTPVPRMDLMMKHYRSV